MPLVSFGIAWFLIGHGMESTFLPLEIVHEHRNYLPLFGILLAVVSVLVRTLEKSGPGKTFGIALMATMLAYFPFVTALRADQFGDEVRRSQIEAQHHRASARAQHEAGRVLAGLEGSDSASSPRYSLAKAHYELAGQLDPNFKMNLLGLIHLNCQAGIPVEQPWVVELQRRLRDTPFAPGDQNGLVQPQGNDDCRFPLSGAARRRWPVCRGDRQSRGFAGGAGDDALLVCGLFVAARKGSACCLCGLGPILDAGAVKYEQSPQVGATEVHCRRAGSGASIAS